MGSPCAPVWHDPRPTASMAMRAPHRGAALATMMRCRTTVARIRGRASFWSSLSRQGVAGNLTVVSSTSLWCSHPTGGAASASTPLFAVFVAAHTCAEYAEMLFRWGCAVFTNALASFKGRTYVYNATGFLWVHHLFSLQLTNLCRSRKTG